MIIRPRRLRTTEAMRALVAETRVHPAQLVLPVWQVGPCGRAVMSKVSASQSARISTTSR